MNDPELIRWGIIGCGDVTEVKSGPAFSRVNNSELAAVMRRNGDLAKDYAARHAVPRWYDDADALISDPDVNAVYVATPPHMHARYTIRALEAGKPVYVEKPMARTVAECNTMIEASEVSGLPLLVAYYRRCLPSFLHIRKLIEDGHIGEVRLTHVTLHAPAGSADEESSPGNWRVIPEIAGGGYFVDLASHQFDFLDFVFGPVAEVHGSTANHAQLYPAEDTVSASWEHDSGVLGTGTWCFSVDPGSQLEETVILGSRGRIRFSFFGDPTVYVETEAGSTLEHFEHPAHIQEPLIETVVNRLLGRGECPSTGYSGLRTTRVLDAILGKS